MKKILIVFYSKTGSTKEVAERLAKILEADDLSVTCQTVDQQPMWREFDGVILGAPINGFKWVPEMEQFVNQHQNALKKLPVAAFCLSYIWGAGGGFFRNFVQKNFNKAVLPITPKAQVLFGGKIPSPMPGFIQLVFGISKGAPLDSREWKEVDAWGNALKLFFK